MSRTKAPIQNIVVEITRIKADAGARVVTASPTACTTCWLISTRTDVGQVIIRPLEVISFVKKENVANCGAQRSNMATVLKADARTQVH